jgi:hypothetical protein
MPTAHRRRPGGPSAAAFALLLLVCLPLAAQPAPEPRVAWDGVQRVIAFADVHGAHGELVTLLREAGVIDAQDRWAAGTAHVASLGDLLDRGADSRQVMDLLMRLQQEAAQAGGGLHLVLGNHEALNLLGDLRYVDPAELAAYTDLEPAGEREAARAAAQSRPCPAPCPPFDTRFPPGWFGHRAAFAPDGRYGRWLLAQPVAIRINDTLFLHGGAGPALQGLDLAALNLRYRTALLDYLGLAQQLVQAGLLQPEDPFQDRPRLAGERLRAGARTPQPGEPDLVRRFAAAAEHPLLSEDGPNWYRGDALCNQASETDVLEPLLRQFGVARLVIGHTPTRNLRVVSRFDGRVIKLDTGMNRAVYRGRGSALILTSGTAQVRYVGEVALAAPEAEGLFVAPNAIDDASVQAAMRDGEVSVTGPAGPDQLNVVVTHGTRRIPAVFIAAPAGAVRNEMAALRLDRLMGLGLVPATAQREVQGKPGLLQARPARWVTQAAVQQQGLRGGGWCSLESQYQLLYALDVLAGNDARAAETLVYDANDWHVYATGFAQSFGSGAGLPSYLRSRPPAPGAEVRRRAALLDEATLAAALEGLLDTRQRRALLQRRDALLALPASGVRPAAAAR